MLNPVPVFSFEQYRIEIAFAAAMDVARRVAKRVNSIFQKRV